MCAHSNCLHGLQLSYMVFKQYTITPCIPVIDTWYVKSLSITKINFIRDASILSWQTCACPATCHANGISFNEKKKKITTSFAIWLYKFDDTTELSKSVPCSPNMEVNHAGHVWQNWKCPTWAGFMWDNLTDIMSDLLYIVSTWCLMWHRKCPGWTNFT